jgi:predicted nucleic acid-binding protein
MSGYADTSFLVSLYTQDANSMEATQVLLDRKTPVLVTPFGEAEFVNSVEQRVFRKEISSSQAETSLLAFQRDLDAASFLIGRSVPGHTYARAILLSRQHTRSLGTRGMDIVHVAIALELKATDLFTFDKDQAKLAKRTGLAVRPGR